MKVTLQQFARTVAAELRVNPNAWIKGASARDLRGRLVEPESSAAVCWCLDGFMRREARGVPLDVYDLRFAMIQALNGISIECVSAWNDRDARRVRDVVDMLERLS